MALRSDAGTYFQVYQAALRWLIVSGAITARFWCGERLTFLPSLVVFIWFLNPPPRQLFATLVLEIYSIILPCVDFDRKDTSSCLELF